MSTWYSVATEEQQQRLLGAYPDVPIENLEVCEMLCESAREQVLAYAPTPGEEDDYAGAPPSRFVLGQLHWIRRIWDAGKGEVGVDGFTFTPRILEQELKAIIRPRDGKPHVL